MTLCSIEDCENQVRTRGWCGKHYTRWRRHGDPLIYKFSIESFWNHIDKSGECWIWNGSRSKEGYGKMGRRVDGFYFRAPHRLTWYLATNIFPGELCVLHKCDNPPCCNPEHLFLGTYKDNAQDRDRKGRSNNALAKRELLKTHCPQGHPYNDVNTYVTTKGHRQCKTCKKARDILYQQNRSRTV